MPSSSRAVAVWTLQLTPLLIFVGTVALFSVLSENFLSVAGLTDILQQATPVAILGIGMTFVLVTAGIDLSVGAVMYAAVIAFGLALPEAPAIVALAVAAAIGAALGAVNAALITVLRTAPFIVTLSTMFVLRGLGKWLTETKPVSASEEILSLGRSSFLAVPYSIWILAGVTLISWIVLRRTPIGRQMYAVGGNPDAAAKAGLNLPKSYLFAYVVCGLCAGIAGFVSIAQQGTAQNYFGQGKEFEAIAAAVLGGVSLFGGRGSPWSAVFGAALFWTVFAGLNTLNPNEYLHPMVVAAVIFVAVGLDSLRSRLIQKLTRRQIWVAERGLRR